uniref:Integrase core domain-containing protein n=1 Tax=Haptolina ericina TaxID=156174 RepID=A0A7S3AF98_9EUKA|mmetsp:Transcript_12711/g.28979  ORF Transcript_12711/g.28979 Transcript_12711/m.28979 type:complete len:429 (+) Transcript_12711:259-1545(+)
MASAAPPRWVIDKVRELVANAVPGPIIAEQITSAGYQTTVRQVKRWKEKNNIVQNWRGDDAALDQVVQRLRDDDELGAEEGYRWVQSVVNSAIDGQARVGEKRVRAAIRRAMPAAVDERNKIVEKRMQRRIYVADYADQRDHIDLECKLIFGRVRLYIYGQACGDSRFLKGFPLLFVKTARSVFRRGYCVATSNNGLRAADLTTADAGNEWRIIRFALEQQGGSWNETQSVHNVRIERPWLDVAIKVVRLARKACDQLQSDSVHDPADIHHQYALRIAIFWCLDYGLDEFRERYNEHNVPGPRGGIPRWRHTQRTRPAGAPAQMLFDATTDWCARYAAHTGRAYHAEDHFVEVYSYEVLRLVEMQAAALPSKERAWKDMKIHGGKRGDFRAVYAAALHASQGRATAESIMQSERDCMVTRGSRCVSED